MLERMRYGTLRFGTVAGLLGVLLSGAVNASTLTLTCELLSTGVNPGCPVGAAMIAVPGQYNFQNSFTSPTGATAIAGSDIYGGPVYGFLGAAGFIDDYFFQISPATVNVVAATIDLGGAFAIGNLFGRIYNLADNSGGLVMTEPNGAVDYGTITSSGLATIVQINPTILSSGSYVLEITGTATGSEGGSYTGTLNLTPVPLPAALPFLLSGVALLGGFLRRRLASPA